MLETKISYQYEKWDYFVVLRHCPKFCVNGNRIQL